MKILLLIIITGFISTVNAQTTIFEDDFESYDDFTITNFGGWVMYDLDGTMTWGTAEASYPNQGYIGSAIILNVNEIQNGQVPFDPSAGNYSIRETGEKYASFWCAQGVTNNNYLVSPQVNLNNVNSPTVSFWAKSLASAVNGFDPEQFEVLLSTTGNSINDFTVNLGGLNQISSCCTWNRYTFNLTDYKDNQIYIAIHHTTSQNGYALHIDDFKVESASVVGVNENKITSISFYPNPVINQINIESTITMRNIKIINTIGQTIFIKELNTLNINTSNFTNGLYYVIINTENSTEKFTFIKK